MTEKFLKEFLDALNALPTFPSMTTVNAEKDTIIIDGVEYVMNWVSDEYLYLTPKCEKYGKMSEYVTARYIFEEDIENGPYDRTGWLSVSSMDEDGTSITLDREGRWTRF